MSVMETSQIKATARTALVEKYRGIWRRKAREHLHKSRDRTPEIIAELDYRQGRVRVATTTPGATLVVGGVAAFGLWLWFKRG